MIRNMIVKRCVHTVPKLPNFTQLKVNGIPKILSAKGFNTIWTQYQTYLCDNLTLNTAGTSMESYLPFHLLLNTSKQKYRTNIFNYASAAHNNHLFIENILPLEKSLDSVPSKIFTMKVEESFGKDWELFKNDIVEEIEEKVIGQGWYFLVENSNKELHSLCIQNNGTPYYFPRNQLFDLNGAISLEEFSHLERIKELQRNSKIKDWTIPLIAINLHDFAYLSDYGVGNRSEYIRNVLDNLNWNVINNRMYI